MIRWSRSEKSRVGYVFATCTCGGGDVLHAVIRTSRWLILLVPVLPVRTWRTSCAKCGRSARVEPSIGKRAMMV